LDNLKKSPNALARGAAQFVFPKPDGFNPCLEQKFIRLSVSPLVPFNLGLPEGAIDIRDVTTFGATMPEAAVKEYCGLAGREKEIGLATNRLGVHRPPSDCGSYQHGTEAHLGSPISPTSDSGHSA